jgi:hypothetical protein
LGTIGWIEEPLRRNDQLATTTSRERSSGAQAARIRRDRVDHGFEHITGSMLCKYHARLWVRRDERKGEANIAPPAKIYWLSC